MLFVKSEVVVGDNVEGVMVVGSGMVVGDVGGELTVGDEVAVGHFFQCYVIKLNLSQ